MFFFIFSSRIYGSRRENSLVFGLLRLPFITVSVSGKTVRSACSGHPGLLQSRIRHHTLIPLSCFRAQLSFTRNAPVCLRISHSIRMSCPPGTFHPVLRLRRIRSPGTVRFALRSRLNLFICSDTIISKENKRKEDFYEKNCCPRRICRKSRRYQLGSPAGAWRTDSI